MRRKKLYKQRVYQHPDLIYLAQNQDKPFSEWLQGLRGEKPLILELGMGTGDFLVSMAERNPHQFFLGVEVKADRIMKGFQKAGNNTLENIAFLRSSIEELQRLKVPEANSIFLLFPDPWPKKRHIRRRLVSPFFLDLYRTILKKNGQLIFKTDDELLFSYGLEQLEKKSWKINSLSRDYKTPNDLQTGYERRFKALRKQIFFLEACPSP